MSSINKISVNGVGYTIEDEGARNDIGKVNQAIVKNSGDIKEIQDTIGEDSLNTTSQTIVGAINELQEIASGDTTINVEGSASGVVGYGTITSPTSYKVPANGVVDVEFNDGSFSAFIEGREQYAKYGGCGKCFVEVLSYKNNTYSYSSNYGKMIVSHICITNSNGTLSVKCRIYNPTDTELTTDLYFNVGLFLFLGYVNAK